MGFYKFLHKILCILLILSVFCVLIEAILYSRKRGFTMQELYASFPHPTEQASEPIYSCSDGRYLLIYRNTNQADYETYLQTLTADGFALIMQTERNGNCYSAFQKHLTVGVYYSPCDRTLRVTFDKLNALPPYQKPKTDFESGKTVFYCFENDQALIDCGMCLLIQCPDNSFFVVDSGHYFQFNDNDRIHQFMRERTPNGKKIVINGWLITHSHTDHVSKLMDFLRYNCDDVVIEGFYWNLLEDDYDLPVWDEEERTFNARLRKLLNDRTAIPKYKLQAGQRFFIRNLTFDVLCTQEDVYPQRIADFNDSSVVVTVEADGNRIFIPGDASNIESDILESRYGKTLKSDIVQISHHGHFGLTENVYKLIDADLAVFPITEIKFWEEHPRIQANRTAIALAKEYFISSNGTVRVPLPYSEKTVQQLPDETFEDFEKIRRLWGYDYTDEFKKELYEKYLKLGGSPEKANLPVNYKGFI
ncbi:MAG TPA: hypothetical protein DDY98_04575 [Ruminococcaceae bacterium]|nr:hypothetical protein [Oscillospiraceae bacterium]